MLTALERHSYKHVITNTLMTNKKDLVDFPARGQSERRTTDTLVLQREEVFEEAF